MAGKSADAVVPESFQTGLQNLIPQIASVMASPGATIKFCQSLMMVVAGKLRQHQTAQSGGGAGMGGGMPGGGGVGGAAPGMPAGAHPPGLQMPGGPAGGGAVNPQMPNLSAPNLMQGSPTPTPDELRRIIAKSTS